MRIGINARFYGAVGKGLGRYTQKLIENLEKITEQGGPYFGREKTQYLIFLRKENFNEYQPKNENFKKVLADFRWYTLEEQLKFPRLLNKYKLDLVHFPHFNVPVFYFGKFIVTIHDLILLRYPTTRATTLSPVFYWLKFLGYKIVINSAIRKSSRIIAVSRFTKNDILENYPKIPQEKIKVTYEACDDYCLFNPKKGEQILPRYGIMKPYILYVGNAYPHKNPEKLILAMKKLQKENMDLKLVFVGAEDYFYQKLKSLVKEKKIKNIIFSGFVPDYDLDAIFRESLAYIRPSLYEGFELPPLEAMARGVPVICSDHACAREILGDSSHYFKADDPNDIAMAIKSIYADKNARENLIKKGYEQVKKYSWKNMARETLDLYENILNK